MRSRERRKQTQQRRDGGKGAEKDNVAAEGFQTFVPPHVESRTRSGTAAEIRAPAGTVAPPKNGLFGNGAPPQVQVN